MLSRRRARKEAAPPADTTSDGGSVLANTGFLIASRLGQAVLGWAGTVLIARTLDVDHFGQFTLIFTILGLMSIVTDMGIGRIALRGVVEDEDDASHDPAYFASAYLVLRTLLGVAGYVLALVVVVLLGYPSEVVAATAVAGTVVMLATPSAALDVVFQSRLRLGVVSAAGFGGLLAQTALTAALAAAGGTLLLFTIPAVLAQVVILAWKLPLAHRLLPLRFVIDRALWGSMLREAIPLSLGLAVATVYYRVDSVMLSRLDTFEAVGIYGVSYKFIDIVNFTATAVTVPLLTVLVRTWPHDLPEFRDALRRGAMLLGLLGGLAAVGLVGFAEPLTTLLYGERYAAGAEATEVLVVAQVLTLFAMLALNCLIAVERHRRFALVAIGGLLINVVANFVLIPRYSYEGAAWATLGSEVVVLSVLIVMVRRIPALRPFALGRLAAVPVAIALGVAAGRLLDEVIPWVPAAAVAVLLFLAVVTAAGVTSGAGLRRTPEVAT